MDVEVIVIPWWTILAIVCFLISIGLVTLIAFRRPKTGVCTLCQSSYSPSCPLIEGVSGTLICKDCIVEMSLVAESNTEVNEIPAVPSFLA